jgi:hypothetical protein
LGVDAPEWILRITGESKLQGDDEVEHEPELTLLEVFLAGQSMTHLLL